MVNLEEYDSGLQFIKFNNGDTIITNVFYHKKTQRMFVLSPMKMITTEKNDVLKISFVKWLPLGEDTVLYEIDQNSILTSGIPAQEFLDLYTEYTHTDEELDNELLN